MKLVYAASVPYSGFAQRPHRFVAHFNRCCGGPTLWLNPYPSRLPRLSDLGRKRMRTHSHSDGAVEVLTPPRWSADPLMRAPAMRRLAWRSVLEQVAAFVQGADWALAIGRPSLLALELLQSARPRTSCYDAMDDFPQFQRGFARRLNRRVEDRIASQVDTLLVSSRALLEKFRRCGLAAELLRNGLDEWPPPDPRRCADGPVLGYVGTIGAWFDWALVAQIARSLPRARIDLIGPQLTPPGVALPTNVRRLGECANEEAHHQLREFSAGLIPFKINPLTAAVDPIKYYEYRAAGLPVVSTRFGEMARRGLDQGVYFLDRNTDIPALLDAALARPPDPPEALQRFRAQNAWSARFAQSAFFRALASLDGGATTNGA